MKSSLVRDYFLYIIVSKIICSHSVDKDRILYDAVECSVVYNIDGVPNWLMVD